MDPLTKGIHNRRLLIWPQILFYFILFYFQKNEINPKVTCHPFLIQN
jgi:hypothetical protein